MWGGSGDCDLYVNRGTKASTSNWDYRPYKSDNDETVTVSNPRPGDWYIMLYSHSAYSGVNLKANYSMARANPTLRIDGGTSSKKQQRETFSFTGSNYTPNRSVTRYLRQPDGSQTTLTPTLYANSSGNISWNYTPDCSTATGTYTLWVKDDTSERESNQVKETITTNPGCVTTTTTIQPSPSINSISPVSKEAGTFDLYIYGSNFDNGAVDQIYWKADGHFVGQGTVLSRSGSQLKVREYMNGATPGTYVVKVKNSDGKISNGIDLSISVTSSTTTTAPVSQPTLRIDGSTSSSKQQGGTFSITGTNYTPNRSVTRYLRLPDGSQTTLTPTLYANSSGNISWNYTPDCSTATGTYTLWVKDDTSERESNQVKETITTNPRCVSVSYKAHFAYTGWMNNWVQDGQTAGTPGGNQMEAIRISTTQYNIEYQAHVAYDGWLSWVSDGQEAGTTNQGKSLQAIRIRLKNAPSSLHVTYRVYIHNQGWQRWVSDGAMAGTTGEGLAVEAIEIKIE